jgi:type I restriction enzyme S subunit
VSDWTATTIGAQVTLQRGFDITKKDQRPGQVPVVSSGGVSSYHDTAMVRGPGVVLGRKGSLGTVFFMPEDHWPHDTTLWVKEFNGNDPRFVYYFFKNLDVMHLDVGSANPTLNRNHVHPIAVEWPPLDEQRRIATILGALDDKIELNRKMNRTLEEMAQAIFKSWFIDFDGHDDLVDSEIGPVPRGWEVRTWGEIASLAYGKGLEGYRTGGGPVRVWGTNGPIGWTTVALALTPTVIVGRKGAYRGVHFADGPSWTIDTAFYLVPGDDVDVRWAHYTIGQYDINSMDSGSAIPSTSRDSFYGLRAVVPPLVAQNAFRDCCAPIWERQRLNATESETLTTLRNTLLPKLISGELRVPDAEAALTGAP